MNCMEHIAGMHMIKIHMIEIHIMNLIVEVCKRFITKRTTSRMFIIDLKNIILVDSLVKEHHTHQTNQSTWIFPQIDSHKLTWLLTMDIRISKSTGEHTQKTLGILSQTTERLTKCTPKGILSRQKATERAISIREPYNTGGNIPIETKKKFSEKLPKPFFSSN